MADFAQEVVDAQAHEIGLLSSQLIVAGLRAKHSEVLVASQTEQIEALKTRILAYEMDINALRLQVAPKNHPIRRKK